MSQGTNSVQNPAPRDGSTNRLASTDWTGRAIDAALSGFNYGDAGGTTGTQRRYPFRITAVTLVEAGRWRYTGTQQIRRRSAAATASYVNDTPTFSTSELWNDAEEKNLSGYTIGADPAYGNGVVKAELASGFTVQPIPIGMVVWAHEESVVSAGVILSEWVFSMPNGVSGECPA